MIEEYIVEKNYTIKQYRAFKPAKIQLIIVFAYRFVFNAVHLLNISKKHKELPDVNWNQSDRLTKLSVLHSLCLFSLLL